MPPVKSNCLRSDEVTGLGVQEDLSPALKSRCEDYRKAVHATAEAIVASDKSARDAERRALERLTKDLGLRQAGRLVAQGSPAS